MEVRSVETIVRALNEAGVRYLIVGGLAVNAHGFARAMHQEIAPGLQAPIVSLPALLAMKRSAGRPGDLEDIRELERCERLRHET